MPDTMQANQETAGDRAATLLLLEKLRFERDRIQAEIDRITRLLDGEIRAAEQNSF